MKPAVRRAMLGAFNNVLDALVPDFPRDAGGAFERLAQQYEAEGRAYHNLDHVEAVLLWIGRLGKLGSRELALVTLAAFYHDAIYDARAKDNEERSAEFAREELGALGLTTVDLDEIERLILLTKTHAAEEGDAVGAVMVDADLAILQSSPAEYDRYAAAIREEYAWVSDEDYRVGRTMVLEGLMARKLFASPILDEEKARANMRREILRLGHHS